jgi:lipopolysaccharide/colanic/teichoic acid biosynthesis glycosyltransferase
MTFEAGPVATGQIVRTGRRIAKARSRNISLGKILFDKAFAAAALITVAPLFVAIAVALRLGDPGPVLYKHKRIGHNGRPFDCYKFRSMRVDGDKRLARVFEIDPIARADWAADQKLENDPRIHRVGHFLRKTSLDELPQFWNVLKGDMSIVGPRPIVEDEIARYGSQFAHYCAVRPGITGAWQVGGRNLTSYSHRVALDVDYVRNATFLDDLRIILKTVVVVLKQKGAL